MVRKVECFTFFSIFIFLLVSELILDSWAAGPKAAKPTKVAKPKPKKVVAKKKPPPPAKKPTKVVKRVTPALKIKIINDWNFGPMTNCHKNFTPPTFRVISCPKGDAVNAFMYMECRTCEHKGPKTVMINCTHRIIRQTKDIVFFCYSDKKELCMGVFSARNVKRSYDEFCKKPAKVKVKVKIAKNKVKAAPKRGGRKRRRAFLEDFRSRGHQFDTVNKIERSYETRVYRLFESNDKNEIKIRHALREMVKNHSWSQIEVQRSQIRQRSTGDDDCNNEDDDPGAKDQNAPGANDEGENKEENK